MKKYFKRNINGMKNCFIILEYITTTMSRPRLLRCRVIYATPNCHGWKADVKNKSVDDFELHELHQMTEEEVLMEVL